MKQKRNKTRTGLIVVLCLLSVLLAALIGLVVCLETRDLPDRREETTIATDGTTENTTEAPTTEATVPTTEAPTTEPTEVTDPGNNSLLIELETPYCALYFPRIWEDHLHIQPVEDDGYRMEFGCRFEGDQVHRLFDISFGMPDGAALGTVTGSGGEAVLVYIRVYEPEETLDGDLLTTFLAMQEDVNQLIALLPLDRTGGETQSGEDILIQTPFCQLTYPGQWEQYLRVEHSGGKEYAVDFYARFDDDTSVLLFSVLFGGDTEDALMVLTGPDGNSVAVNVELEEIPEEGLPQEQLEVAYSMQDAMNDLLDTLAAEINA